MSKNVGEVDVVIKAQMSQYESALKTAEKKAAEFEKTVATKMVSAGNSLSSFGSSASRYVSAPLAAAGIALVKFASDAEETNSKISVVFKDSANDMFEWSKTTIEEYGLAGQSALDMAAKYGDMATSFEFTSGAAAEMGRQIVGRVADLSSFKNIRTDIADTAMTAIFTGETESLKQLGVIMTQANLDTYALAQGMGKTTKQMNQQELVMLRLNYVMDATANASGDFARTSESTANQTRKAKEQLKEMAVTIGTHLLPVANDILTPVSKLLKYYTDMDPAAQKTILALGGIAIAAGPLAKITGTLMTSFGTLGQYLSQNTVIAGANAAATAGQGAAAAGAAAGNAVNATATAATGVAAAAATPPVITFGAALKAALPIIGLIAAAAAILIPLIKSMGESSNSANSKVESLNKSMEASAEASKKTIDGFNDNAAIAKKLTNELFTLEKMENKTNDQKKRMATLVGQINELMPDMNLLIDDNTGELSKNRREVDKYITAKTNQLKLIAREEELTQAYKDQYEAEKLVLQAKEDKRIMNKWLLEGYGSLTAEEKEYANGLRDQYGKMTDVFVMQGKVKDALTDSEETYAKQTGIVGDLEDGLAKLSVESDSTSEVLIDNNAAVVESAELTEEELAKLRAENEAAVKEHNQNVIDATADFKKTMFGINEDGLYDEAISLKKLNEMWSKNIEDMKNYHTNLAKLSEMGFEDLASIFEEGGVQMGGTLQLTMDALQGLSADEWAQIRADWRGEGKGLSEDLREKLKDVDMVALQELLNLQGTVADGFGEAADQAIEQFGWVVPSMYDIGQNAIQGLINGANSKETLLRRAFTSLASVSEQAALIKLGIYSPSKVFAEIGKNTMLGWEKGIKENAHLPVAATENVSVMATQASQPVQSSTYNQNKTINANYYSSVPSGSMAQNQLEMIEFKNKMKRALA